MNARSRLSHSAIPHWHWHRMWPHQKDRSAREGGGGGGGSVSRAERAAGSPIYIYIDPCLKVWYFHRLPPTFTDYRLHSEIMDLYYASPCRKWCPTIRGLHSPGVRKLPLNYLSCYFRKSSIHPLLIWKERGKSEQYKRSLWSHNITNYLCQNTGTTAVLMSNRTSTQSCPFAWMRRQFCILHTLCTRPLCISALICTLLPANEHNIYTS